MATVSDVTTQPASGLNHIDALLNTGPGWNWLTPGRNTLLYTFSLANPNPSDAGVNLASAPTAFNASQQSAVTQALTRLTQLTGIVFTATSDASAADLHFAAADLVGNTVSGFTSSRSTYSASGSTVTAFGADAWVYLDNNEFGASNVSPAPGNIAYQVLLHELGHALGLKHPFEGAVRLPAEQDNTQNTLLSYTQLGGPYADYGPYDIAALRFLYGGDGLAGALGQGGNGRYLTGTAQAETLLGGGGNDVLEGGGGNDTLTGGEGSDLAVFSGARALYTVAASSGSVTVSGPDGVDTLSGVELLRFSDQTVSVSAATNRAPTGSVTLSGTPSQGTPLTATVALADEDGLGSFSYRWQSSSDGGTQWADIAGATGIAFTPAQAQVGLRLRAVVSYTDGLGHPESVNSVASSAVANVNDPPGGSVSVIGGASVGSVLSVGLALTDADGVGALSYRWQSSGDNSNWTDIAGATSPGLVLASAHLGLRIRVQVSYVDGQGTSELVTSAPTVEVGGPNSRPTGALSIAGTVREDEALTVSSTLADVDGMGDIAYRWQASAEGSSWADIGGATAATFTATQAQVGKFLRVVASYVDGKGAAESVTSPVTVRVVNVNDLPTGSVTITGTVTQGGLLTIQQNLADADGLGQLSYRWQSSSNGVTWADIEGATSLSFSPGSSLFGQQLRARVDYTDAEGTAESVASAATVPVGNVNSAPQGSVSISGERLEGRTLQVQNSIFDSDGVVGGFNYRWQMSADGSTWADIIGATGETFVPLQAQVGQRVRVVASYIDGKGMADSMASSATEAIANVNAAPVGSITIRGTVRQGSSLTLTNTVGDQDGLGTFNYRWQSSLDGTSWSDITGATAASLVPAQAQVGRQLRVVVSYVDGGGTPETVLSAATAAVQNVNDPPTGALTISGTPQRGETLTAVSTVSDADGLGTLSYRWQVAAGFLTWADIEGATSSTFVPTLDQVGKLVRVTVSYVDGQGTAESVASAAAPAVLPGNTAPTGTVAVSGSSKQGSVLSASANLSDADGLGAFEYSWQQSADGSSWTTIDGAAGASFTPGAAQVGQLVRARVSYVDGKGYAESVTSSATSAVVGVQRGSAGADTLVGTAHADEISGLQGADRLTGAGGNDTLLGGEGIDTAVYARARADYQVGPGGGTVQALAGSEGNDVLLQIERIAFADRSLAFDLDGNAGLVARLLGAVFGREAVANTQYAGIGLAAADGGMSAVALAQLALDARLGAGFTPVAEINLLYQNLVGSAPSAAELAFWQGTLTSGQYTPASLALMAANLDLNAQNIDLVGLTTGGLAYT